MSEAALLVVVIETPNSLRSIPLISKLEEDSRFNLVRLSAVIIDNGRDIEENQISLNLAEFEFFKGRTMAPREVGCAHSHNLARALLSNSLRGGVVLEDDARIKNIDLFYKSANDFLNKHHTEAAVLSLNQFRKDHSYEIRKEGYQRLFGPPYLAVAYVATSLAAIMLSTANQPIRTVSDWPTSKIRYFSLYNPLVLHGDAGLQSTIDLDGKFFRGGTTIRKKLLDLTLISYFRNPIYSISFRKFIAEVYWSKITWRLDTFIRRLLKAIYR